MGKTRGKTVLPLYTPDGHLWAVITTANECDSDHQYAFSCLNTTSAVFTRILRSIHNDHSRI
jgi:hypothetical protein